MNKLLLLNAFEGQLEKLAQDRDETPQKSMDERERDMGGSVARVATSMSDSIKREKKRIGRSRTINQMKPKMFRDAPSGLLGTLAKGVDSAGNVYSDAQKRSGHKKYDTSEAVGRATTRASQLSR